MRGLAQIPVRTIDTSSRPFFAILKEQRQLSNEKGLKSPGDLFFHLASDLRIKKPPKRKTMAELAHRNGKDLTERAASVLQPDPTVADEYLDTLRAREFLEPEKRLMLAVLEDAVGCFQKYLFAWDRKGRTLFREIEAWILEEEGGWVFSFNGICEALGLSPGYVRHGLMHWKEKELAKQAGPKVFRPNIHHLHSERQI